MPERFASFAERGRDPGGPLPKKRRHGRASPSTPFGRCSHRRASPAADGDAAFTGGHRARPLRRRAVAINSRLIVLWVAGRFQHLRQPGEQVLIGRQQLFKLYPQRGLGIRILGRATAS